MRHDAGLALGSGDHEVGAILVLGGLDLAEVVQDLVYPAEGISVHLVAARRLLQIERGDDLRVVDRVPVDGAAPGPHEDAGKDEQSGEAASRGTHVAWNLPGAYGGNPPWNARGAAIGRPSRSVLARRAAC